MKTIAIFDLDGTVIDSSHRQLAKPDGSLDLAHWVENSTREKVMQDSLLPFASEMRDAMRNGQRVIVCTARVMSAADLEFMLHNSLYYHAMLSRPEGCKLGDADLKEFLLRSYAQSIGMSFAQFANDSEMFDDNISVINRVRSLGIACYNAQTLNTLMVA